MHLSQRDIAQLIPPKCRPAIALLLTILSVSFGLAQRHSKLVAPGTVPLTLRSQRVPVLDGNDIRFSRLSSAQGLSQTQVAHIVQDDQGFMWFGTQYGLDRYDGYEFRVFTHDPARENSLSCVYIHSLFKDSSGTLWVGCDQFLDRFDSVHETFTHYRIDAGEVGIYVSEINQDRTGMLWLATGSGLFRLNPETGQIVHYVHDPANPSGLGRPTRSDALWKIGLADSG